MSPSYPSVLVIFISFLKRLLHLSTLTFFLILSAAATAGTLSVSNLGSGNGMVTSDNEEIVCGDHCTYDYPPKKHVLLTATPDTYSHFLTWSAGVCEGQNSVCALNTSSGTQTVAVYFAGAAISAGGYHTVALKSTDGAVWAWGKNNAGQLGDGTTTDHAFPVQVGDLRDFDAVSAGYEHTVALNNDGTVWAWGSNTAGQLGDGTFVSRNDPVAVAGLNGVIAIAAGYKHNVALKGDGTVLTWGANNFGQLGDGTTTRRTASIA